MGGVRLFRAVRGGDGGHGKRAERMMSLLFKRGSAPCESHGTRVREGGRGSSGLVVGVYVEVGARVLLLAVLDRVQLVDAGAVVCGVTAEGDGQVRQEQVHARQQALRGAGPALYGRGALVHNHAVREVRGHDEVVLHDERRLLGVHDEPLDRLGGDDALLGVEVGGGLVDEVDVRRLPQAHRDGHALQLAAGEVLDVLVHEALDLHGLHDVRVELGVHVALADLGVQHGAHAHLALGGDLLGLVAHVELGDLLPRVVVRRQHARQHADERRLARAVLAEHDEDLRVGEVALLHVQDELAVLVLGQRGVLELVELLRVVLAQRVVRHLEGEGDLAEAQVLGGHEPREEDVDALAHAEGERHHAVGAGLAVQAADEVGEVIEDAQVVLHDNHVLGGTQQLANHLRGVQPLLDVQVGGGLVEHVDVPLLHRHHADGEALQLPSRQVPDVALPHWVQVEKIHQVLHLVTLIPLRQHLLDSAVHRSGNVVDILWLDDGLEVVLKHAREVVLEL
mmetsp:Transcript_16970/g.36917  ORF Transcript_16970/g.36917 Transcript_16970/m.36917 type:complete len:509 (-) Transcript_16970:689-2215(-)